jgi:starvation-inducible DNA-binding protein
MQENNIINYLNKLLASFEVFAVKMHNFHWNVEGSDFLILHEYFGKQYSQYIEHIDVIAELIRQNDHKPISSMAEFLQYSELKEESNNLDSSQMLRVMLHDLENIRLMLISGEKLSLEKDDSAIADILIEMLQSVNKEIWIIKSMIK